MVVPRRAGRCRLACNGSTTEDRALISLRVALIPVTRLPYANDCASTSTSAVMLASSGQDCVGNAFLSGLSLTDEK